MGAGRTNPDHTHLHRASRRAPRQHGRKQEGLQLSPPRFNLCQSSWFGPVPPSHPWNGSQKHCYTQAVNAFINRKSILCRVIALTPSCSTQLPSSLGFSSDVDPQSPQPRGFASFLAFQKIISVLCHRLEIKLVLLHVQLVFARLCYNLQHLSPRVFQGGSGAFLPLRSK